MEGQHANSPAYQIVNVLCANGMHQREIANIVGVTRETINKIATGKRSGKATLAKLYALYESLHPWGRPALQPFLFSLSSFISQAEDLPPLSS